VPAGEHRAATGAQSNARKEAVGTPPGRKAPEVRERSYCRQDVMNLCKTCDTALNSDGTCPVCRAAELRKRLTRTAKRLRVIDDELQAMLDAQVDVEQREWERFIAQAVAAV
jgi:hypothetical protein